MCCSPAHEVRSQTPDAWQNSSSDELIPHHRITVLLPIAIDGYVPFPIHMLATDLPGFPHRVGDLAQSIDVALVNFRSSNAPIVVDSVSARNVSLVTSAANITGHIYFSDTLNLSSPHGAADVDVDFAYDGPGSSLLLQHIIWAKGELVPRAPCRPGPG
jgi:hypothetical protein